MKEKIWTRSKEKFLQSNIFTMKYRELAEKFGVSTSCVYKKAKRMGLLTHVEHENGIGARLEIKGRLKMKNHRLDIKVGDTVEVTASDYDSKKLSTKKKIKGKVIYKNENYITVQGKRYRESFRASDFYTGQAKIKKLEIKSRVLDN